MLEWLRDCAVAVMSRVYVPAGVPLFVPGETPPPPPAPPPQAAIARQIRKTSDTVRMARAGGRRLIPPQSSTAARKAHPNHIGNNASGRPRQSLEGGLTSDRAVVCTVRVAWAEPEAGTCTVDEENEHVVPPGTPLQASETGTSNPLTGVIVNLYLAVCPA